MRLKIITTASVVIFFWSSGNLYCMLFIPFHQFFIFSFTFESCILSLVGVDSKASCIIIDEHL